MKLKSYIFLIFNIGFCQLLYSQETTKKYKGEYLDGEAEYQYYEDENFNRRLNGSFKYSKKTGVNTSYHEFGTYKNGLKSGAWKIGTANTSTLKATRIVMGNYINNLKNGKWTYSFKNEGDGKVRNEIIEYKNDTIISYNLNTKDLIFAINATGYLDGPFYKKYALAEAGGQNNSEVIAEFYKGYVVKYINRNMTDGNIYIRYLPNKEKLISVITTDNKAEYELLKNTDIFEIDNGYKFKTQISEHVLGVRKYFQTFIDDDFYLVNPKILELK